MGREVSAFIIITTGKHAGSVLVYYHLSVIGTRLLELWADQRESARADIRGRAPYRSQIDKINTLSLEMTMLDNQTRKYQFFSTLFSFFSVERYFVTPLFDSN